MGSQHIHRHPHNHPGIFSRDEKNFFVVPNSAGDEKIFGEVFKVSKTLTCFTPFKSFSVEVKKIVARKRKNFRRKIFFFWAFYHRFKKFSGDSAQKILFFIFPL